MDGKHKIEIPEGHIKDPYSRPNEYTGNGEWFDPKQIFTSPSIKYASHDAYAQPCYHPFKGKNGEQLQYKIKFVFQCRQKPGSYTIGHDTTRNPNDVAYDKHIPNIAIEWYTAANTSVVLTGLLMHVSIVRRKKTNKKKH